MKHKFAIPLAGTVRPVPNLGWHHVSVTYGATTVVTRRWEGQQLFTQVERVPYNTRWLTSYSD